MQNDGQCYNGTGKLDLVQVHCRSNLGAYQQKKTKHLPVVIYNH